CVLVIATRVVALSFIVRSCLPFYHPPFSLLVSFYSSGDLRALHSFPTRRSSDLGVLPEYPHILQPARSASDVAEPCQDNAGRPPDRKSTRLNSSHVSISYAVFCLKKKTSKRRNNTTVVEEHTIRLDNLTILTNHN